MPAAAWGRVSVTLSVLLAFAGAGCAEGGDDPGPGTGAGDGAASQHEVSIHDNTFNPLRLDVKAGETVTFLNAGADRHTVTIHRAGDPTDQILLDRELATGETIQHTFPAGTYHVWCKLHGGMTTGMAMVVQAS